MRYTSVVILAPVAPVQSSGDTFLDSFDAPSSTRGRGGDLNPAIWAVGRLTPTWSGDRVNHIRHATIPAANRASFAGGTSVYPPDDMLITDGTSVLPGTLMTGVVIQNYGHHDQMARQPFDFAGRTGKIFFDVDAVCEGPLGTYIVISITDDPVPCPTFLIADNNETGPVPKNGILIALSNSNSGGANTGVGSVYVYTNYSGAAITATSEVTGASMPTTQQDKPNHFEIRVSSTTIEVYASDKSTDGGASYPNQRSIWLGTITAPLTRGYVHFGVRNHATVKYGFAATHVYHWDNCKFDGPVIAAPRAYEIPDNTTSGTSTDTTELDYPYSFRNLGYEVSNGANRAEGIWNPDTNISPFTIAGVDLTGMTSGKLTLNVFMNTISHTADTTWGMKYKFNGGTWRTRNLTSAEVTAINLSGAAGYLMLVIDITFADLTSGSNTLDFSTTANVPQDYPVIIQNADLLLSA